MVDDIVLSQPMDELAVRNAKYAKECIELHLANRYITKLQGFEVFPNLEVLWLNDNRLTRLENLNENFRVKVLYAHNNRISSLKNTSVTEMSFLHHFTLYNNRLTDLASALSVLRLNRHMKSLDLFGNPLAEEKDYRLHVIKQIPWLEIFDQHRVTDEERQQAAKLRPLQVDVHATLAGAGSGRKPKPSTAATEQFGTVMRQGLDTEGLSQEELAMQISRLASTAMDVIKQDVKTKRVLLKAHFLEVDRRGENVVTEEIFRKVMTHYGLWPRDTESQDALLIKYEAATPKRSMHMGRDTAMANARFVDYIMFCRHVEPRSHGRDHHDRDLRLATEWRKKVPTKSVMTQILERDVNTWKRTMAEEERRLEEERRRAATTIATPFAVRQPGIYSDDDPAKLSPWEVRELKTFFKNADKDKSGSLSPEELHSCLESMELVGRKINVEAMQKSILEAADGGPGEQKQQNFFEFLFAAFDSEKGADGKISWTEFVDGLLNGVYHKETGILLLKPIEWLKLNKPEANKASRRIFKAGHQAIATALTDPENRNIGIKECAESLGFGAKLDHIKDRDLIPAFVTPGGDRPNARAKGIHDKYLPMAKGKHPAHDVLKFQRKVQPASQSQATGSRRPIASEDIRDEDTRRLMKSFGVTAISRSEAASKSYRPAKKLPVEKRVEHLVIE